MTRATKKTSRTKRSHGVSKKSSHRGGKKWSGKVDTDSTHPPAGTFNKNAESIARIMSKKSVSPKGLGSAIRMVQFYINRAGKDLSASRRRELEKAKAILQEKRHGRASNGK